MYNLLMSASDDHWDKGHAIVDFSRYLEYTNDAVTEKFKALSDETVRKLTRIPTLFAYELGVKRSARVGWITDIQRRQGEIRISFEIDKSIPPITPEQIQKIYWDLDISEKYEVHRTHWAVKDVDLLEVLRKNGFMKGGARLRRSRKPLVPPYTRRAATRKQTSELSSPKKRSSRKAKVFIVHGRADQPKRQVARFLKRIGVEPVILHERPNGGRTLIAKFQEESADIEFAVVLMTPDDVGGIRKKKKQLARARQNVIFELGFFIGKLGAGKVCALVQDEVEKPSDFDAVVYIKYGGTEAWKAELTRELQHAGIRFDSKIKSRILSQIEYLKK